MTGRRVLLALGGACLAGTVAAQDLEAGRKVANMCRTCHGLDGYAQIPVAPHIGGEPAEYLADQLNAFRSGAREHEMMSVVASAMSDAQIADVAAWYAAHEVVAVAPEGLDPDAAPELCVSCHGTDGIALIEGAPNLAAENAIYTETQLKAFRSGRREHEIMSPIAAELDDDEMRVLARWYEQFDLEISEPAEAARP